MEKVWDLYKKKILNLNFGNSGTLARLINWNIVNYTKYSSKN